MSPSRPSSASNRGIGYAPRAAFTLATGLQGLVRCTVMGENSDASIDAVCYVGAASILAPDVDLGAGLNGRGFGGSAVGAPFESAVQEKIARAIGP
jgi:hypothetical protein